MTRRQLLQLLSLAPLAGFVACAAAEGEPAALPGKLSKAEWKKLLPADAYGVLFEQHTERAGTSPLDREKRRGVYVCAACFHPLFDSEKKFDSGTGWPSFFEARQGAVATRDDHSLFMRRTEHYCAHCGGHQGHLFDDGPRPTGLRYCNNGLALRFVPAGESLPAPRA